MVHSLTAAYIPGDFWPDGGITVIGLVTSRLMRIVNQGKVNDGPPQQI